MHITRAFLEGMQKAGPQEIRTIDVIDKQIEFCRGCFACKYNGGQCSIDDDMRELLEQMLSSDVLLFSCGCGFPSSRRNFEPAVRQFELLFPQHHTILTVPESPMFNAPEAAVVTVPRLALVKQAGQQYAESGTIDEALLAEIGSPMIPEETYAKIVNGTS